MPEASQIECPHCETKLKIKNPSLFGKKIRCPKCSEPFVAETPPADEDEFAENLGSLGDDFGEPLPSAKLPAMPGRSKGPGKTGSKSSGDSSDAPRPKKKARPRAQGNTLPWITWPLFGFGGGLIASVIWVIVGYSFQREVGFIAWGVGLCVGLGVRMAAGDRAGLGAGLTAIAISIFMILASKFAVAYLLTAKFVNNMAVHAEANDDDSAKLALAVQMAEEEPAKGAKGALKEPEFDINEATSFKELPKSVREKTEARWKKMTDAERKELREQMAGMQQLPRIVVAVFVFIGSFGVLDLLWFGFASFTAFRVASGAIGNS